MRNTCTPVVSGGCEMGVCCHHVAMSCNHNIVPFAIFCFVFCFLLIFERHCPHIGMNSSAL